MVLGQSWLPRTLRPTTPSIIIVHFLTYDEIVYLVNVQLLEILFPKILEDVFIGVLLLKVIHLCICFGPLNDWIRYGWNLWVGEVGWGFSHGIWLAAVTVRFSEISLQFFHFWENLSDALGPRSMIQPSKSVHRTMKPVLASGSELSLFLGFLPL